ncbi:MAG: hypothetical protein IMZ60_01340 [Actinobacteria bacterium]|nr:hypothetical protein [Actinomycetota bacterium]
MKKRNYNKIKFTENIFKKKPKKIWNRETRENLLFIIAAIVLISTVTGTINWYNQNFSPSIRFTGNNEIIFYGTDGNESIYNTIFNLNYSTSSSNQVDVLIKNKKFIKNNLSYYLLKINQQNVDFLVEIEDTEIFETQGVKSGNILLNVTLKKFWINATRVNIDDVLYLGNLTYDLLIQDKVTKQSKYYEQTIPVKWRLQKSYYDLEYKFEDITRNSNLTKMIIEFSIKAREDIFDLVLSRNLTLMVLDDSNFLGYSENGQVLKKGISINPEIHLTFSNNLSKNYSWVELIFNFENSYGKNIINKSRKIFYFIKQIVINNITCFLIDSDGNNDFNEFYNSIMKFSMPVDKENVNIYLIDYNYDGIYDFSYNSSTGQLIPYQGEIASTSWLLWGGLVVIVIIIIGFILLFLKRDII